MPFAKELLGVSINIGCVPKVAALLVERVKDLSTLTLAFPYRDSTSGDTDLETLLVGLNSTVELRDTHRAIADGSHVVVADSASRKSRHCEVGSRL